MPRGRDDGVVGARQARDRIEQDHDVALVLHQALGLFDHHFGHLHVARGGLVEGGTDDFAAHAALHVGDFFRTLVDQQHDQRDFGMIGGDGVGDALQQHRLTGARRRHDQAALAFADGRQQIHHAAGVIVADGFQLQPLVGIQRRQVVEEDLVARFLGRFEVDGIDFDQREVALAFLGRADLAADGVAGAQIETADLAGRDVDIVGAGKVVVLGRAQEAEAVGQAFQHAFAEDQPALFGLGLKDLEDQFLLAQAGGAGDVHALGHVVELLNAHVLQFDEVERGSAGLGGLRGALFAALRAEVGVRSGRSGGGRLGGRRRRWAAAGGAASAGGLGVRPQASVPAQVSVRLVWPQRSWFRRLLASGGAAAAAAALLRRARRRCGFSAGGFSVDFSTGGFSPAAFRRDSGGALSRVGVFSVGFSDCSCGRLLPTVGEVLSLLLAKFPSLPGH